MWFSKVAGVSFCCLLSCFANAAIALVTGQITANSNASSSVVLTLPNNPTNGNLVVVGVTPGTATLTVSDGNSNSYTLTPHSVCNQGGSAGISAIAYFQNVSNGSKTITATSTGSSSVQAWAAEFSGAATSGVLETDICATAANNGGSSVLTTPSITTANNGDLLWGAVSVTNTVDSVRSPWTLVSAIESGNASEYYIQPSAGAQTVGYNLSGDQAYASIEAAFKASGAAPPPGVSWRTLIGVGK